MAESGNKSEFISFRLDEKFRAELECIRESLFERDGIMPRQSDIIRTCLERGMKVYCKEHSISLPEAQVDKIVRRRRRQKADA